MIPFANHYWITNAQIPEPLMVRSKQGRSRNWSTVSDSSDRLLKVDLEILDGIIASIATAGTLTAYNSPSVDLRGGMVFPCFVDLHTHLDKGQTCDRAPNPDGTFASALTAIHQDTETCWNTDEVYRRMEFGLRCSYAHGTQAIRTHLDAGGDLAEMTFEVFQHLQQQWADRLTLQAVCLVRLEDYLTPAGEQLADRMAELGGILGGVTFMQPDLPQQLDRVFALAKERNLRLDLHTDETHHPDAIALRLIAETTLRYRYQGRVICGHCCSLAVQSPQVARQAIALVKQAGIGIVSLPLCNLYLQDRQSRHTPRWRGVTLLHELKQAGVPVVLASDNCRDAFYGYGDHDLLEVLSWSTKIAHLDCPYDDWCRSVTLTPADLMGLPTAGRIGVGLSADLVLFRARRYSELFSRSQGDRTVLRRGRAIDTTLPDYAELDPILQK